MGNKIHNAKNYKTQDGFYADNDGKLRLKLGSIGNYKGEWVSGDEIKINDIVYVIDGSIRKYYIAINNISNSTISPSTDISNFSDFIECPESGGGSGGGTKLYKYTIPAVCTVNSYTVEGNIILISTYDYPVSALGFYDDGILVADSEFHVDAFIVSLFRFGVGGLDEQLDCYRLYGSYTILSPSSSYNYIYNVGHTDVYQSFTFNVSGTIIREEI